MLKVRDIMSRDVVTLSPELTLDEAGAVLAQKHISGAPVVANGRVLGVVSQSDILEFAISAAATRDEPTGVDVRTPEEEEERRPLPTWEGVGEPPAASSPSRGPSSSRRLPPRSSSRPSRIRTAQPMSRA